MSNSFLKKFSGFVDTVFLILVSQPALMAECQERRVTGRAQNFSLYEESFVAWPKTHKHAYTHINTIGRTGRHLKLFYVNFKF